MSDTNKPHPHAELIKAWADGAEIEYYCAYHDSWRTLHPSEASWTSKMQVRLKPAEPPGSENVKEDVEWVDAQNIRRAEQRLRRELNAKEEA